MSRKLLVFRELDGCWSVVRGSFDDDFADIDYPRDWLAEGVGSWERAMRIACETAGVGWSS